MIPYLGIAQGVLGGYQMIKGNQELNKLQAQPVPQFTEDPVVMQNRVRAQQDAQYGYSPSEIANYNQRQAHLATQRYRMATAQAGSSLAGAIGAGINYGNINAAGNFASQDAALKRQNIRYADSFGQNLQSMRNRNTDNAYNYRMMAEKALGNAVKVGSENAMTSLAMADNTITSNYNQKREDARNKIQDDFNERYLLALKK